MRRVLILFTAAVLLYLSTSYWYLAGSPYSQYSLQNVSSYIIRSITEINYYFRNLTHFWHEIEFWFLTQKSLHQRLENLDKIEAELQKTKLALIASQTIINKLSLLTHFKFPKDLAKVTVKVYGSPIGFYDAQIVAGAPDITIRKDAIAIADQGIVGRIIESSGRLLRIMLITDMASRVPVKIIETGENCIAVGNGTNIMTLEHLQSHEMITNSYKRPPEIGDVLVTSGVGGIFPPDLPVGTITSIKDEEITIKPFVIFHTLEVVSILYDQAKL